MSARSRTEGPGRPPLSTAVTEVVDVPVPISSPSPSSSEEHDFLGLRQLQPDLGALMQPAPYLHQFGCEGLRLVGQGAGRCHWYLLVGTAFYAPR